MRRRLVLTLVLAACASPQPPPARERVVLPETPDARAVADAGPTPAERAGIETQVGGDRDRIDACYRRALEQDPTLAGTLTVRFIIRADGVVTEAHASGLGDSTLLDCVEAAILTLRFPPPEGGGTVTVTYPFQLQPDD